MANLQEAITNFQTWGLSTWGWEKGCKLKSHIKNIPTAMTGGSAKNVFVITHKKFPFLSLPVSEEIADIVSQKTVNLMQLRLAHFTMPKAKPIGTTTAISTIVKNTPPTLVTTRVVNLTNTKSRFLPAPMVSVLPVVPANPPKKLNKSVWKEKVNGNWVASDGKTNATLKQLTKYPYEGLWRAYIGNNKVFMTDFNNHAQAQMILDSYGFLSNIPESMLQPK